MGNKRSLRKKITQGLLNELYHFLWTESFINHAGIYDPGLSCRDHALISVLLFRIWGYRPSIITGKMAIVIGEKNGRRPFGVGHDPHAWLIVEKNDIFDLSIKPFAPLELGRNKIPIIGVFENEWAPKGKGILQIAKNEYDYKLKINIASNTPNRAFAIYLEDKQLLFSKQSVTNTFKSINTPLTDRLREKFDESIYSKLVLHLFDLSRNKVKSLTTLTKDKSWEEINSNTSYDDAIARIIDLAFIKE